MRYHNITKDDMLNGDGLRVVLWVAGCSHCCKECQNPVTWDPDGGILFDEDAKKEIFEQADEFAKLKTWQIFQPLVTSVSPEFVVEMVIE